MFRAIFSLIIRSILTAFTTSGIIHVCRCRLMSWLSRKWLRQLLLNHDISWQRHTWIIPEAVYTVKMLLMMSENIVRNTWSNQVTINCIFRCNKIKINPNRTSLNENYIVPCICLRAIWHTHGSMWRATRMTRDRKHIIVAHCVIALWRHYCWGHVEGHFSGYPSHKTYTCQSISSFSENNFLYGLP